MCTGFSGEPLTRRDGPLNMILQEDFHCIDSAGKNENSRFRKCYDARRWRGAGEAERGRLEICCTLRAYRGFESHPLRHSLNPPPSAS